MSRHYATACRMWSTASNCRAPSHRTGPAELPAAATRILSSCPRAMASAARFADANPVTTPAGTSSLPFVSIATRNPRSWSACTRSSPNRNTGSGHVHCVCHADDGASATRSGRCQSQLEALGSGRVPPPIIIEETEMNATDEKSTMGRTAQYDWQNLVATHEHLNQDPRCPNLRAAEGYDWREAYA